MIIEWLFIFISDSLIYVFYNLLCFFLVGKHLREKHSVGLDDPRSEVWFQFCLFHCRLNYGVTFSCRAIAIVAIDKFNMLQ